MLRLSPTLIPFTLADLDGLDERIDGRRSRLAKSRPSNVRLSPGPAHPARLAFVPANQNVGCERAESSSSDVVYDTALESPKTFDGNSDAVDAHRTPVGHSVLCQDTVRELESVADRLRSPSRPSPARLDSFYQDQREIEEIEREIAEHSPASNLDGVIESEVGDPSPATPLRSLPQTQAHPRPFSSARARRRHARSSEDPRVHHVGIRPFSTQSQMWLNPVPQLVLPTAASETSLNQSLDPGAPVFVPRTRFGVGSPLTTNNGGLASRPWRSLDHTSSSSNLRARSPAQLNIEQPILTPRNGPAVQRASRTSRTSDQNTALPLQTPNLERYPILVRQPSATLEPPFVGQVRLGASSPAFSSSSRSTPNLLQTPLHPSDTHSRGSSLSWRHTSRQSSREGLDAAAEFLRMRASPLDDLTERLGRLSAGRQRSVGRSWLVPERRGRVSLLTGDPFRQSTDHLAPMQDTQFDAVDGAGPSRELTDSAPPTNKIDADDPVAVAMALPPSSPPLHTPPSIKRKPLPVYDDAKPPATQPQTPADVGSSRLFVGRSQLASPERTPPISGRNPYRNTYPPAPTTETSQRRARRRAQTHRSSENEAENDIEGNTPGLEQDRRVWQERQEDGDLDVTPPREGRFERYLS